MAKKKTEFEKCRCCKAPVVMTVDEILWCDACVERTVTIAAALASNPSWIQPESPEARNGNTARTAMAIVREIVNHASS